MSDAADFILIPRSVFRKEFGKKLPPEALAVFRRTARESLAEEIRAKGAPAGTKLLKAYATSSRGPRRLLYLLRVSSGHLLLLMYRDKSDSVGQNMSPTNPAFNAVLAKHLDLALADLASGRVEIVMFDESDDA